MNLKALFSLDYLTRGLLATAIQRSSKKPVPQEDLPNLAYLLSGINDSSEKIRKNSKSILDFLILDYETNGFDVRSLKEDYTKRKSEPYPVH